MRSVLSKEELTQFFGISAGPREELRGDAFEMALGFLTLSPKPYLTPPEHGLGFRVESLGLVFRVLPVAHEHNP